MKRGVESDCLSLLPLLPLPIEIFDTIVSQLYSFRDTCYWYTCQKDTSHRWKIEHIKSLLTQILSRNREMYDITYHSYYIRNSYIADITQEALGLVPGFVTKFPGLDFCLSPTSRIIDGFRKKNSKLHEFFPKYCDTIEGKTPLSLKQRHIFRVLYRYIREHYGFEIKVDVKSILVPLSDFDIFEDLCIEDNIYFSLYPPVY